MRTLSVLSLIALLGVATATVAEPRVQLRLESRELYAGLPFALVLEAEGFEETPQPEAPELSIDGAKVVYLGVNPNVSQQISIINGRRTESRDVTFSYRWRIEVPDTSEYTIAPLTVTQGALSASTPAARFTAQEIEATQDMQVRVNLPDRPVWVGETFAVEFEWLLSREVEEFEFVVPLFEEGNVQVAAPKADGRSVNFNVGARSLALPLLQDQVTEGNTVYARLRFPALVTINSAGPLEIEPVRVAARLQTGATRDRFGFRRNRTQLFQAVSERGTLVARALPLAGRPASFVNAIGSGYSIEVDAARTVVQVGDPIELQIRVRGDGALEGLSLPELTDGGLPTELFSVADAADIGTIDDADNSKVFAVTVRVRSSEATEIPPLELGYFDPQSGQYATATSRPIALSVAGSSVVGAAQVESANPAIALQPNQQAATTGQMRSLVGADMALSPSDSTLTTRWRLVQQDFVLLLLYGAPLLIAGIVIWLGRTSGRRSEARDVAQASASLDRALQSSAPMRESAPAILAALRHLALACGVRGTLRDDVVQLLETVAYDPASADEPLPAELRDAVRALAEELRLSQQHGIPDAAVATVLVAAFVTVVASMPVLAEDGVEETVASARSSYAAALAETDRVRRVRLFGQAELEFRDATRTLPDAAGLLADWGNAALGAEEIGWSVLAYRRALHVEPGNERASRNLAWLRDRLPGWVPRPPSDGAFATLLFWEKALTPADRYLLGALAFAIVVLMLVPWGSAPPWLRKAAVLPALVWLGTTASAWFDRDDRDAAVITADSAVLRSADSIGAAAAFANPLPAGTELIIQETRDNWVRVLLGDGTEGWIHAGAVARVVPADL